MISFIIWKYESESDDAAYESSSELSNSSEGSKRSEGMDAVDGDELRHTSQIHPDTTAGELKMPFKPFIESIGHETLSQGDNDGDDESADELNNVNLDAPILPEHLKRNYNYTDADLALEREEQQDILGHGNVVNVWNRLKAFESERYYFRNCFLFFTL